MAKKIDKKLGRPAGERWITKQPECVDLILNGIADVDSSAEIARAVAKKYNITHSGALKRVKMVWERLAAEAGLDKKVERQKISRAILDIYREARDDMGLANCIGMLTSAGLDEAQRYRILAKWDPYKGAALALKALEQHAKLCGLNAPELLEVKDTTETVDPLTMTPQQRRQRITELLAKGEIKGPLLGAPSSPPAPPTGEEDPPKLAN